MKKCLLIVLLGCMSNISVAQEKTYGVDDKSFVRRGNTMGSLVILPFEDAMYQSDADAPIGRETGLEPGQLLTKFRSALVESLEKEMQRDWDILVFHEEMKLKDNFGLEYVHASVKYNYVEIPHDVQIANDTTIEKKTLKKSRRGSKMQSGIYEGEVKTYSDKRAKYMTMILENDSLVSMLNEDLDSEYYLFLNEFDIRYQVVDPDLVANGGLNYMLKVHFNCIDKKGRNLISGAATTNVPATTKNIYEIISQGIPVLSAKLAGMIRKYGYEREGQ